MCFISTKNGDTQATLAQKSTDRNGTLPQPLGGTGAQDGGPSAACDENSSPAITSESSTGAATLTTTSLHQIMLLHDALTQRHPLETANPMASLPFRRVSATSKSWFF